MFLFNFVLYFIICFVILPFVVINGRIKMNSLFPQVEKTFKIIFVVLSKANSLFGVQKYFLLS